DGVGVAALDDMVVGYAAFLRADFGREQIKFAQVRALEVHKDKGKTAFLLFCGVLPSFRRRGIGEALVRWVKKRARALGCDEVQVVATQESRDFFMRLGFQVFREDRDFIEGLPGIRMGTSPVIVRP
ncbi:MAG TPA: GNAT family N-acetyltransferase, partial [Thermoanaerobaculia bacterium]|nr:GNAT family N-acetyltransferase [Thermoanaerobaculia bacterium]